MLPSQGRRTLRTCPLSPSEAGTRTTLEARCTERNVPALLTVSATVRRAQVERVVGLQILLDSKSDADEPTRSPPAPGANAPAISASITQFDKSRPSIQTSP